MKVAKPLNGVVVLEHQYLPDGVNVLIVPCKGYEEVQDLPKVVECEGTVYGYTGCNSDCNIAYYRDDAMIAIPKVVNAFGF